METAKLRITDRPPPKIFAQATIEPLAHWPINSVDPAPIPARRGRRLDVDAVLARSLPRVVSEQLPIRVRNKELKAA
jgi:hypothetical protein